MIEIHELIIEAHVAPHPDARLDVTEADEGRKRDEELIERTARRVMALLRDELNEIRGSR